MRIQTRPAGDLVVTLHLSRREATVLRSIFRNLGGSMSGPRGMTDAINRHLADQGVPAFNLCDRECGGLTLPNSWTDKALVASQALDEEV